MSGDAAAKNYTYQDYDSVDPFVTWVHYQVSFDGNTNTVYQSINGILVSATLTSPSDWRGLGYDKTGDYSGTGSGLTLTGYNDTNGSKNFGKFSPGGWWSDVRVYKGICKYTEAFSDRTELTFATDQDLADFAPGDAVRQDASPYYGSWALEGTATGVNNPSNFLDGTLNGNTPGDWLNSSNLTSAIGSSGTVYGATYTFNTPVTGTSFEVLVTGGSVSLQGLKINGVTKSVGTASYFNWLNVSTEAAGSLSSLTIGHTGTSTYSAICAIRVDGTILADIFGTVDSVDAAANTMTLAPSSGTWSANTGNYVIGPSVTASGTVASTDSTANTITLSSSTGTWTPNAGKYVVGPVKTAGSGTIASVDVAANTMTLSASTGTWVANAAKFAVGEDQPSASVRLYTVHDAAGAVSDLQSADPGYVTMTGTSPYTLTFPATFPTGNAPDVDLPAGTSLTTEVQATSTGSTPAVKTSNTIVPS